MEYGAMNKGDFFSARNHEYTFYIHYCMFCSNLETTKACRYYVPPKDGECQLFSKEIPRFYAGNVCIYF